MVDTNKLEETANLEEIKNRDYKTWIENNRKKERPKYIEPDKYKHLVSNMMTKNETHLDWSNDPKRNSFDRYDELTLSVKKLINIVDEDNSNIGLYTWYVILSKYFDDIIEVTNSPKNVPLRFSAFIIQPSRTGKNTNVDLIMNIAKNLNMNFKSITSYTEKAITGLVDTKAIEHNHLLRAKIKKDPEKYDESMFREEYKRGLMETEDIIIVEEAKGLFTGGFKENLIGNLQEILDTKGYINISTGTGGNFTRPSKCCFIMTTIPIQNKTDNIADDGFFQRFAILSRKFTNEELNARHQLYSDSLKKSQTFGQREIAEFTKEISEEVKKTKNYYMNLIDSLPYDDKRVYIIQDFYTGAESKKLQIYLRDDAREKMNEYINKKKLFIENNFFGDVVTRFNAYVPLLQSLYIKISALSMILSRNREFKIEASDIDIADVVVDKTFYGIINLISPIGRQNNEQNVRLAKIIGFDWISSNIALRRIASATKMNDYDSTEKLTELEEKKYIDVIKNEKTDETKVRCSESILQITLFDNDLDKFNEEKSKPKSVFDNDLRIKLITKYLVYLEENNVNIENILFRHINYYTNCYSGETNYVNIPTKLFRNDVIIKKQTSIRVLDSAKKYLGDTTDEELETIKFIDEIIKIEIKNKDELKKNTYGLEYDFKHLQSIEILNEHNQLETISEEIVEERDSKKIREFEDMYKANVQRELKELSDNGIKITDLFKNVFVDYNKDVLK